MTAKRTLAEQVARGYLRAARWSDYPVRVELEDGTEVTMRHCPEPDVIYVEHVETGHGADFRLDLTATQLPAPGPEDDGALRAELAAGVEPESATALSLAAGEHPGPALLLRVLELARRDHRECAPEWCGGSSMDLCSLAFALERLDAVLRAEAGERGQGGEAGHWEPGTWGVVKDGDRVRLQGVEATVERATPVTGTWVGGHRGVPAGTEESYVAVWLVEHPGRDYQMKPSGAVEVWRPALADWAAHAFHALAAGGLKPERVKEVGW